LKYLIVISILFLSLNLKSQFFLKADTLNKARTISATAITASAWTGSFVGLSKIWYEDYEKTKLHSFNDLNNWMQMDKVGHIYSSYHFSQQISKMYRWSGVNYRKAAVIGSVVSWGYLFSIELLDGKSSNWGFSCSDLGANTLGNALYCSQELIAKKQHFKLKFSYFPSEYAQYRPNVLGNTFPEKLLKDYNAQTYWLCFSPVFFKKESKFPKWINLAIGYSVDQKLVGDLDVFTSPDGKFFQAKREFALSLDIDVKALNIKKQWLKSLLSPFNSIKFPFPSLNYNGTNFYAKLFQ
jgi:hypothetical protein